MQNVRVESYVLGINTAHEEMPDKESLKTHANQTSTVH